MKSKVLLSLLVFTSVLNAEKLKIGVHDWPLNTEEKMEEHINRCFFDLRVKTSWVRTASTSDNFDDCTKLVRINDNLNVYCTDNTYSEDEKIEEKIKFLFPAKLDSDWIKPLYTRLNDDTDLSKSENIREFNRVNWQYVDASKEEIITKCLKNKFSLNTINDGMGKLYAQIRRDKKAYIDCSTSTASFKGAAFDGKIYTFTESAKSSTSYNAPNKKSKVIKENNDSFKVKLQYNFTGSAPTIEEAFREYSTNTTGRVVVETSKANDNRLLLFLTESFIDDDWVSLEAGSYLIGNNYFTGNQKDHEESIYYPKYEDGYLLKPLYTLYDFHFVPLMKKKVNQDFRYVNEGVKRYSEQLLLKNTRVRPINTTGFTDRYYGGSTKCYTFDIKKFETIEQNKVLRVGYFLYNNIILRSDEKIKQCIAGGTKDIDCNDKLQPHIRKTMKQNDIFYFSIHKSNGEMAGVYRNDGGEVKYSLNLRPNKSPAIDGLNTTGFAVASLKYTFYPDAKSIEVSGAQKIGENSYEVDDLKNDLSFTFKGLDGKTTTSFYGNKHYISKYQLKYNNETLTYPNRHNPQLLYLEKQSNGSFKLSAAAAKSLRDALDEIFDKTEEIEFTILEVKDHGTGDWDAPDKSNNIPGGRPVYQTSGDNIIKGTPTTIKFTKEKFENDLKLTRAFVSGNKIKVDEKGNYTNNAILTRTDDHEVYLAIQNPSGRANLYFYVELDGKKLDSFKAFDASGIDNTTSTVQINKDGKPFTIGKVYKGSTVINLGKLPVQKDHSAKITLISMDSASFTTLSSTKDTYENLLNNKQIRDYKVKAEMPVQSFSIRHKGIAYTLDKDFQKVEEGKLNLSIQMGKCLPDDNPLGCDKHNDTAPAAESKLTYASLIIKDEYSGNAETLYLDDGENILDDTNATANFKSKIELNKLSIILPNLALPLVTKAKMRFFETFITSNDSKNTQCNASFNEEILDIKDLNKIDDVTGQIYCRTPMCDRHGKCEGKGVGYEFSSNGVNVNIKSETEPESNLKGIVPFAGKLTSAKSIDGKKPLDILLYLDREHNYLINFPKDDTYNYGKVEAELEIANKDGAMPANINDYVKLEGGSEISFVDSIDTKNDCGYTKSENNSGNIFKIGGCINISNKEVFKLLEKMKKDQRDNRKKLADLYYSDDYKVKEGFGEFKVLVSYPKLNEKDEFITEKPFNVRFKDAVVNNIPSTTKYKYTYTGNRGQIPAQTHLFTRTGLYFKDVSNSSGNLFEDKGTKVSSALRYMDKDGVMQDLVPCGSNPCYTGSVSGLTDVSSYSWDYLDSKVLKTGSDLIYTPHKDNKAEYIKDTIRFKVDKSSYLGSEKNSFTIELRRKN